MSSVIDLGEGDGRSEAVSSLDRGLHFGDGLFETIACCARRPRFLPLHLDRLAAGCARLKIEFSRLETVRRQIRALAAEKERGLIKLLVTRGPALARGYAVTGDERATCLTIRYPWPLEDPAQAQDGVRARTLTLRLGENPSLAGLKHCNRLEQVLARQEWSDPQIAEGLLFSSSGRLVSGTMSNIFIVRDSELLTPPVDLCGVAGVMRHVVLREAARAGIAAREYELSCEDLVSADEIFLTNARIGIWPVRELDSRRLSVGARTRQLQQILQPLLEYPPDESA